MFPSRDIKGNVLVRSVYSSPACLFAKAAKMNTLATEILSGSMRLALDIGQSCRPLLSNSSSSVLAVSTLVLFVRLVWLGAPGLRWLVNCDECF